MNYSFSTVLMTILASNLVIILITLCFRFEKLLLTIGYRLLAVFLVLTLIRLVFPFELMFTKSVYLPESVSTAIFFLQQPLFGQDIIPNRHTLVISPWFLFECIWFVGCALKLFHYIRDYLLTARFIRLYGCDISHMEPVQRILQDICGNRSNRFRIFTISGIKTPVIFGIHSPHILIPDSVTLSNKDWYFILQHETFHYFHHDLLIKAAVNLLCILYWWNPACKSFQAQVDLLLEMHVDNSLSKGNSATISAYLRTLLRIAESTTHSKTVISSPFTVSVIGRNEQELVARFKMLCRKNSSAKVPFFLALLSIVVSIYTCSYLFIFELSSSHLIKDSSDILELMEGFHAVPTAEGNFNIYYNDTLIETVDSLKYYREIPLLPAK